MDGNRDTDLETRALRSSLRIRQSIRQTPPEIQNVSLDLIVRSPPPESSPADSQEQQAIQVSTRRGRAKFKDLVSKALREMQEKGGDDGMREMEGELEEVGVEAEVGTEIKGKAPESFFGCNVCLDVAGDPVITTCGHLFCWPCLYVSLQIRHVCPLCKDPVVPNSDVIPIYGRGTDDRERSDADRMKGVPPRPPGQRVESSRSRWSSRTLMPQWIEQIQSRTDIVIAAVNRLRNRVNATMAESSNRHAGTGSTTRRRSGGAAASDGSNADGSDSRQRTRRRLS